MYKKAWCTNKVVVLRNKPIAFLTSSLPSPSSLLKLPSCHFDGTVSSNVRYARCCHGRDRHAESPVVEWDKIDQVSPFYSTLWLKMGKPTRTTKNKPLGCRFLHLCVSKLEVFTQLPSAYHENSLSSMVSYRDFFNNPSQFPGMFLQKV